MNLLEENTNFKHFSIQRSYSNVSTATRASISQDCSPKQVSAYTSCMEDHEHSDPLQISQMIQQKQQIKIDLTNYLKKRKNVMNWLQRYGSQLNLSRNGLSAAQNYVDIFYHNTKYEQKKAKLVLTALLILASKHSDYKILFTNHIAYICDLDKKQLNRIELQCCCKLGFNFISQTYVIITDRIINKIRDFCNINLYTEDEENYVKLRIIHKVVQKLYCEIYQWYPNQFDILQVFIQIFKYFQPKNNKLQHYLTNYQINSVTNQIASIQHSQIKEIITGYIKQIKENKEEHIRNLFRNRKNQEKYLNYSQFVTKYYQ